MNNIRKYRREMKLTQIELARMCNITQGMLSNYETGKYEVDYETLKRMADIFHVTTDELLNYQSPIQQAIQEEQTQMNARKWRLLSAGSLQLTDEQLDKLYDVARILYPDKFPE